jgi:choloylglycine hydrolase
MTIKYFYVVVIVLMIPGLLCVNVRTYPNTANKSENAGTTPKRQCTSFVLNNNGYAVFGSNFDYGADNSDGLIFVNKRNISKSYWQTDANGEHARWTSKFGSVSFNLIMSQFSWAGMNEAGLVISTMQLDGSKSPAPDKRPWIYSNYWLQYVLDNFATVEEVIASDSSIRIFDYVDHYLVSDRYGNCAAIEFIDGKMVFYSGKKLPIKVLSNSSYDRSASEWNKYCQRQKDEDTIKVAGSSIKRFCRAGEMISAFESTDNETAVKTAFDILDQVSGQKTNGSFTRWSIVFDAKDLTVHFRTINHTKIRYIDLRKLDFSCNSQIKMLDINEKMEGNISGRLKDYSSQLHFNHAQLASKKWGVEIEPEELLEQIKFIEGFPRADSLGK